MKTTDYALLPSKAKWKMNSALWTGARDPVLRNIDTLVGTARSMVDPDSRAPIYFELYFSLNYWLRYHKNSPAMQNEREGAIRALFRFVVRELAKIFGCGVQAVPNVLEDYFGRRLTAHGARIDGAGLAVPTQRARLEKWKLFYNFSDHKFHQIGNGTLKLSDTASVADSFEMHNSDINAADLKEGFANFVLTMGGDIYMAPHAYNRTTKQSFFHSSYNAGEPVMCAGSIRLNNGSIDGIQNNSGHYAPTDSYIINLLKHLLMLGHPVTNNMKIYSYGGNFNAGAEDFLAAHGNWQGIIARQSMRFANDQARMQATETAETTFRHLSSGVPLHTLVEQRYQTRSNPDKTWAQIWDEVILDLMGQGGDFKGLYEKPAPRRKAPAPPRQKPPIPTNKPWRAA